MQKKNEKQRKGKDSRSRWGRNPFSYLFLIKMYEGEILRVLCYFIISRQIQGRRNSNRNCVLPKREDSFMMEDVFHA
ncbi:hypothetical protein DXA36_02250 [Eisenbergiella sp. OF01-20]|nr:hypothetical protein DXA36_02250 [Eisenbergiella sp. OF01-20]